MIAGAGSDREGNSYNVNADSAAGKVAAALPAYKAIFLTDVEGWREDADDPASLVSQTTVAEVQASLASVDGGMRPKLAACVEAIAGGVAIRAHPRRQAPSQPAARAVHRRRNRHEGDSVSGPALDQLRAIEARYAMPTYPRFPVEFVRGEGATLWDADGRAYVDLFSGLSVHNAGNCHPADRRRDRRAGRDARRDARTSSTPSPRWA